MFQLPEVSAQGHVFILPYLELSEVGGNWQLPGVGGLGGVQKYLKVKALAATTWTKDNKGWGKQ